MGVHLSLLYEIQSTTTTSIEGQSLLSTLHMRIEATATKNTCSKKKWSHSHKENADAAPCSFFQQGKASDQGEQVHLNERFHHQTDADILYSLVLLLIDTVHVVGCT